MGNVPSKLEWEPSPEKREFIEEHIEEHWKNCDLPRHPAIEELRKSILYSIRFLRKKWGCPTQLDSMSDRGDTMVRGDRSRLLIQ